MSATKVTSKTVLKGVKKRVTSEATWADDQKAAAAGPGGALKPEKYILNKSLPRCRSKRQVSRSVLVLTLPSLRDATPATRAKLLLKKLRLCSYVFDFGDTPTIASPDGIADAKEKEVKRATLLELVNYLTVFKPSFTEEELKEIFEMLACNLFRPLPPSSYETNAQYNPEEDEPRSESTWPHLQVVYEFLLRLATSTETDAKLLDKYFSRRFVLNLLELFDSEDPRERDYLKTILHRIYGNFMSLRPFIRKAINNVFFKFIYETDRHNGIAELLEILGSIINGFALPLKEQHKQFLKRVLLPLHKVSYLSVFHPQLSYCVTQFLEKDQALAPKVVSCVLKFWPQTTSKKELMYLNEVEEILDRVQAVHLGNALVPLFKQVAKAINSPHFQVSERAIYILNNDVIVRFVSSQKEILVPILSKALYSNTHLHNPNLGIRDAPLPSTIGVGGSPSHDKSAAAAATGGEGGALARGPRGALSSLGLGVVGGPAVHLSNMKLGAGIQWREMGHWNPTIVELTHDMIKLLNDMDTPLVNKIQKSLTGDVRDRVAFNTRKKERWAQLMSVWNEEEAKMQRVAAAAAAAAAAALPSNGASTPHSNGDGEVKESKEWSSGSSTPVSGGTSTTSVAAATPGSVSTASLTNDDTNRPPPVPVAAAGVNGTSTSGAPATVPGEPDHTSRPL